MLIPTPLDEILEDDNAISGAAIEPDSFRKKVENIKEEAISDIILNNINVQFALTELTINDSNVSIIGFLKGETSLKQLEKLKCIFSTVIILSYENRHIACSISKPTEKVLVVFEQLKKEHKLNKWIHYFILKPYVEDIQVQGGYRHINDGKTKLIEDTSNIMQDAFFEYICHNERNLIVNNSIEVSGFTLDELDVDPYIKTLSEINKKVYIYILKDEHNLKNKFIKFMKLCNFL